MPSSQVGRKTGMYRVALLSSLLSQPGVHSFEPLQLRIEAPPQFAAIRARLETIDPRRLTGIASLVGITDVGAPINVILTPEDSELARKTPWWISGFAVAT